ncbi:hypothetical protein LTR12_000503 [Friedmanniomyces endolithicus]|nr:hypothetical protein LTR12_000503 [Friedmanniomyces endolithicus]
MSSTSDIKNLRAQVANDLDIYKAEKAHFGYQELARTNIYKAEKARFYRLQGLEPEEVTEADRMSIINWSRASIRDYSFRLEQLENLDDPTVEQREVMQLLNRLIMLGDEVHSFESAIGEITSSFIERYETKFGKSKNDPAATTANPPPAASKPTSNQSSTTSSPAASPAQNIQQPVPLRSASPEPKAGTHLEAAVNATSNTVGFPQTASPLPDAHHSEPVMQTTALVRDEAAHSDETNDEESDDENEASGEESGNGSELVNLKDPKGVYAMLGVSPDASMPEVQKAIRKMLVASHPDRNPDNPDAASDFAEFMSLCEETVKTEEKRRAYDNITTADELEQLTKRVRTLTMSKSSEE